jgi:hypothetical protein
MPFQVFDRDVGTHFQVAANTTGGDTYYKANHFSCLSADCIFSPIGDNRLHPESVSRYGTDFSKAIQDMSYEMITYTNGRKDLQNRYYVWICRRKCVSQPSEFRPLPIGC